MTKTNVQPIPSNSQRHDTPNNKTHVIKFRVTAEEKTSLELTCKLLVKEQGDDIVSEAFRILRTNMAFLSKKDKPAQVITFIQEPYL